MPPGISGYSDGFRQFIDFAQQRIDAGDGESVIVAQSSKGPLDDRTIASVSTSATDKESFFQLFARSDDDKQANLNTRTLFRAAIEEMFQGKGGIPPSVEDALQQAGSTHGRPLTARTIIAVQNAIDATGLLGAVPPSGKGGTDSVSAQLAAQDGVVRSGPTILEKLGILMSRAGQKAITGVNAGDLKKTLRFTKVPHKQRDILDTFARQASAALAQIDKLKPSDIGAAYRAGLGADSIKALKADPNAQSVYQAAVAIRNAIGTQANLSESLRLVQRNTDLKESKYDALTEMRLVCDRRLSEINHLAAELAKMSAGEADAAAGGRSILQMLGDTTIAMHGNAGMFAELEGDEGGPSATARLADKLESYRNRTDALSEDEYRDLAATIHDAKADFESLERKVAEGAVKNVDTAVLVGARGVLDEILADLDSTGRLAFAAVNDYADRAFLLGNPTLFGAKALSIYRQFDAFPNLVSLMQMSQNVSEKAKAVIANPSDAAARREMREAYDQLRTKMRSSAIFEAVKQELSVLHKYYESILDDASSSSKAAFSEGELAELRSALAGLDATAQDVVLAKMEKEAQYPGATMDHIIDAAERAGRLGRGAHTGEAVRAIVEGRTSFGTMVELFAHGLGPGDIPPSGIDDAHLESMEFLGQGGLNSVYKVTYHPDAGNAGGTYVFKSELAARETLLDANAIGEDDYSATQQMLTLNLATQDTADALGAGDMVVRTFGGKCRGEYGTFMELAPGQSATALTNGKGGPDAFGKEALQTLAGQVRGGDPAATAKARNLVASLARSANRLEWLDMVSGQIDRHGENYFVHIDGQSGSVVLKAIDNDLGFSSRRPGLLKFELDSTHLGRFTMMLGNIRSKLYPGVSLEEFNAAFHLDPDHGVEFHSEETATIDFSKMDSQLPLATLGKLSLHCAPLPDEIDEDMFKHLVALGKQADGTPTPQRAAYLDRLRTRLDQSSFDAAVSRLDEAIALARKLNDDGKVRAPEYWESDEAIASVGRPRTQADVRSLFPKIGDVEPPSLEELRKSNPFAANQMETVLDNVSEVDHYLRRDLPDVCDLASALSARQPASA